MTLKKALTVALTTAFLASLSGVTSAQQLKRTAQPSDQTFDNRTTDYSLNLSQFLEVPGVTGQIVILESDLGNIPLEMLSNDAPKTVTNFLSYVNDNSFDNSIIHRSVPGFIIQGGGFKATIPVDTVPEKSAVVNEYKLSNLRGTVAMAKIGGDPNSATNGWFINLADNSENLNNQNGGFTVFAKVIGSGMDVADAIEKLPRYNFGSPFDNFPLERLLGQTETVKADLFVEFPSVYEADLFPGPNSTHSFVRYTAISSSNTDVATVSLDSIIGSELTLSLGQGIVGSSDITVTAEDPNGNSIDLTFTVTLEAAYVTLDTEVKDLGYQSSNYNLGLDSNTTWQAENVPSWVTLSATSGDGSEQLTVTVAQNDGTTPREATFSFNGQNHTIKQGSDFDSWLSAYFSANEIAAMTPDPYTADSDGDGLSNLVENILKLDPSDRNSHITSQLEINDTSYSLIYKPYSELVNYSLESSSDLEAWAELALTPEITTSSIRFQIPAGSSPSAFYQLAVDSEYFTLPGN